MRPRFEEPPEVAGLDEIRLTISAEEILVVSR